MCVFFQYDPKLGLDYLEQCVFVSKFGIQLGFKERVQIVEGIEKYVEMMRSRRALHPKVGQEEKARENPLPISHQGNLLRGIDIKVIV